MTKSPIGQPISRVDGRAKVTGAARYAADWPAPGLLYGYVVSSEIARGKIEKIDLTEALAIEGVVQVFTHENAPSLAGADRKYRDDIAPPGSPFRPLHDAEIHFSGQPIALVVARTFEIARYAASIVRVTYRAAAHSTDLMASRDKGFGPKKRLLVDRPPKPRGKAERAFDASPVQHEAEYLAPPEHHNPMELFGATVVYEDDGRLLIYEKTQGVSNDHRYLQKVFGMKPTELRVMAPFVGGGFGSGLRPSYALFLAVLAARELKRSVRVTITRQQMFTMGHRPATLQRVALGASADGKLQSLTHEALSETSRFEEYTENVVNTSGALYKCANVTMSHEIVELDINTPVDMRAPGSAWGAWALESAMDELAYAGKVDPLALRETNYAERDGNHDRPFSSKELRACYRQGAERFGWDRRSPEPRSMREGHKLIGWGVATGFWEANQMPAIARAILSVDGKLTVSSGTTDIGPGTYTVMTQIAAAELGLAIGDVTFRLGDSTLPLAPVQGGSFTVSTVGSAVKAACAEVKKVLARLAKRDASLAIPELMRKHNLQAIEKVGAGVPNLPKQSKVTRTAHTAVFVEVKVDADLGVIEVSRVVTAVAAGRIMNPKLAQSQIMGGIVWGIGMALEEKSEMDHRLGRYINDNYAEYHVPVNADIQSIEVLFVEEEDTIVNPLGAKGVGELGLVGVAAAVANAIFHATGVRVRELPITLDNLL